jgi:hypothetical protein
MNTIPKPVVDATMRYRAELVAERDKAIAKAAEPFNLQIAEIDNYLGQSGPVDRGTALPDAMLNGADGTLTLVQVKRGDWNAAREVTKAVVKAVKEMLDGRAAMGTDAILKSLEGRGIRIPHENPKKRLVQILSANPEFKNLRGLGWALASAFAEQQTPVASQQTGVPEEERLD